MTASVRAGAGIQDEIEPTWRMQQDDEDEDWDDDDWDDEDEDWDDEGEDWDDDEAADDGWDEDEDEDYDRKPRRHPDEWH